MSRETGIVEGMDATSANLVRLLGEDQARALSAAFGGRRLYVPRQPGPHHPITAAIGQGAADCLAAAFHGVGIDVPMNPATRAEIRRLAAEGRTRADIARVLKITERWVYKTLSEVPSSPSPQGRLFG